MNTNTVLVISLILNALFLAWIVLLQKEFNKLAKGFDDVKNRAQILSDKMNEEISLILKEKEKLYRSKKIQR